MTTSTDTSGAVRRNSAATPNSTMSSSGGTREPSRSPRELSRSETDVERDEDGAVGVGEGVQDGTECEGDVGAEGGRGRGGHGGGL